MDTVEKVIAHTCFQPEPLKPKKCRCREFISKQQAATEVAMGMAQYILVVDKILEIEDSCPTCGGLDLYRKSCTQCSGSGRTILKKPIIVPGEDIIRTVSADGKKNTKTTQVKKSPTIEKAHIERAYVSGNREEQKRIEIYGELNRQFYSSLIVGYEPEDNEKTHIGRRYDFGRSV